MRSRPFPPIYQRGLRVLRLALATALLAGVSLPAAAWNANGHRLIAVIAWQAMPAETRDWVAACLHSHPDFKRWQDTADSAALPLILAEAATWADDIRGDPRYYDETREAPTPPLPGLPDHARHKRWHYVDLDAAGTVTEGELDRQIVRLRDRLAAAPDPATAAWALVWLLHLVGDIHQPLHVGRAGDEGGNRVEIENASTAHSRFTNLHSYWDELPGTGRLRGARLEKRATALVDRYRPARQGDVSIWRRESHALLGQAYPTAVGSLLPLITPEFHATAKALAEQRLVDAGFRLAGLLNALPRPVSRETP